MTENILYRVLGNEDEEIARIFFEVTETGEQIEGAHQIQKWVNSLFEENEKLKSENEDMRRLINNISYQRDEFHRGARENANRIGILKKVNNSLRLLLQNWKALDEEKDEQLDKQNQALKKLKNDNEQLYELIDFANTLIAFKTPESCQKEWEKRLEELRE